ncbi:uncharacterized protein LOC122031074 [Zingiber officinale]|uniref:uncharacterized protein LOC122031074 n=1 Tax=Zingiber officinale TaxID=94328 RepID=UPI001C4BE420|nr:uncharacterized protein LOC122031074 [Zingiber officinale]
MSVILGGGDGINLCFLAGFSVADSLMVCSSDAVARSLGICQGILYQSTLSLISGDQMAESSVIAKCCDGSQNNPKGIIERIYPLGAAIGKPKSSTEGISPAKIAQSEWKSLTESDNSSESTANTMRNFEQTMQTNIM